MIGAWARIAGAALLITLMPAGHAIAHGSGAEPASDAAWRLAVCLPLLLAGGTYFAGLRRTWRRAGRGRGIRPGEAGSFAAGMTVLALMLAWPLHAWGRLRFAPHMIEHELLIAVAAPLLAAGRPGVPCLLGLPGAWRRQVARCVVNGGARRFWRMLWRPGVAWTLHGVALWLWHAPVLFEAALRNDAIHYAQHASLLGTALLFWGSILPRRADAGMRIKAVVLLFTTSVHATLLGALLTLSPTIWYAAYLGAATPEGLSALEDQQLAGVIMWVPGGVVYLAAALILGAAVLRDASFPSQRSRAAPPLDAAPPHA